MPASKYTHDVVASQHYQSGGEDKKSYTKVGAAFTDDQGRISIKLDYIPIHADWSGWLSLYPPKDKEPPMRREEDPAFAGNARSSQRQRDYAVNRSQPRQNTRPIPAPQARTPAGREFDDGPITEGLDDEIPF